VAVSSAVSLHKKKKKGGEKKREPLATAGPFSGRSRRKKKKKKKRQYPPRKTSAPPTPIPYERGRATNGGKEGPYINRGAHLADFPSAFIRH